MAEMKLIISPRFMERQFERAGGASIPKLIAELVTNSDDSYKRILQSGSNREGTRPQFGEIMVEFDRARRTFRVIDHAEGLTYNDMLEKLRHYGEESDDRRQGFRTRSLFGKGLRDVMFSHERGNVCSIKDGEGARCKFIRRPGEDAVIDPTVVRVTEELRKSWGIPNNGTVAEFRLRSTVRCPQHDTLARRLSNFYMLRPISSNPQRRIQLSTSGSRAPEIAHIRFREPHGELLVEVDEQLSYENTVIHMRGRVCRTTVPLDQGAYEDREGGILLLDENDSVLDLTLFGYEGNPHAARFFGQVRLDGADVLFRRKLNSHPPVELLTETRDGLDRKKSFYEALAGIIDPILRPLVEQEISLGGTARSLPPTVRRRHQEAFQRLNELYRQSVGDAGPGIGPRDPHVEPPTDGLAFEHKQLKISVGKTTPTCLLVDAVRLPPGTPVTIASNDPELQVSPPTFLVEAPERGRTVIWKVLRLVAHRENLRVAVSASALDCSAVLVVRAVNRPVDVPHGLAFLPSSMYLRVGQRRWLRLLVDTGAIPSMSSVHIEVTAEDGLEIDAASTVIVPPAAGGDVSETQIGVRGMRLGARGCLKAQSGAYEAVAKAQVVSKKTQEMAEHSGAFRGWEFTTFASCEPSYLSDEGTVQVNLNEPINRRYFGCTVETANEAVVHFVHAQIRLADLILDETLWKIANDAFERNVDFPFPKDHPPTAMWRLAQLRKGEQGSNIYSLFVDERALRANELKAAAEVAATAQEAGK